MKISTENAIFREFLGEETCFKLMKDAGFDAVDYSFFAMDYCSPEWLLADNYLENAHITAQLLKKYDLECFQSHAPLGLTADMPQDESNPQYLGIMRSLEYAGVIGAKCVVVHALTPPDKQDVVKYNIPFYNSLVPLARKTGVKIAIENLFTGNRNLPHLLPELWHPDQFTQLLANLPQEYFTVCLDVGHSAICGMEPDEFLRLSPKGMVTALHIHDNDRLDDLHTLPYLSKLDWDKFIDALREYEFDGPFNLELFRFFYKMPQELYPYALKLAAETARCMVKKLKHGK